MAEWAAQVELDGLIDVETAEVIAEEGVTVAMRGDLGRTIASFRVDGEDLFAAADRAGREAWALLRAVNRRHPDAKLVALHVGTTTDLAVATFGADKVPLVGLAEIGQMAGGKVSREAVRQWTQRPDFPPRIGVVSGNPAFFRPAVEDFLESIGRLEVERLGVDWMFEGRRPEA